MKAHFPIALVTTLAACSGAGAQGVQNMDLAFLFGPVPISSHVIPGSNVTLSGQTASGIAFGYGYQLTRISAASLWLDLVAPATVLGRSPTSISGSVNNDVQTFAAAARLMVPVQSRVSVYGIAGGGGGSFHYPVIAVGSNPYVTSNATFHGVFETGGGIDVRLKERLSLRAEMRDFITGAGLSGVAGRHHIRPLFGFAFHI